MTPRKPTKRASVVLPTAKPIALISDVRELILQAREGVARAADSGPTTLYWHVGRRVRQDILKQKRAEYGGQIVSALGRQLPWTHFVSLIYLDDPLKRDFYAEMCVWPAPGSKP